MAFMILHLVEREREVTRLKHVLNQKPPDAKYNKAMLRQYDLLARLQLMGSQTHTDIRKFKRAYDKSSISKMH